MTFKSAVITFPGSNCDRDLITTLEKLTGHKPVNLWHEDTQIPDGIDLIAVPGGFSYGDYLRSGAIAARSKIMPEVIKHSQKGGYVIGICNGFQILTETRILPGTLSRNKHLKFICKEVNLKIHNSSSAFTKKYSKDEVFSFPVAHHDGNYFADSDTLKSIEDNDQIAFQYCAKDGQLLNDQENNPNGSLNNIAGILSENKRVLGMMPHPERKCDKLTLGDDGVKLFEGIIETLN